MLNSESISDARPALHLAQGFGDEGCDLVGLFVAVREGLIETEIGQRETTQRRLMVVTGVETHGTVRDVNAVTA